MIELVSKDKCTGCMACLQACPMGCIGQEEDVWGNLYPRIDYEQCIGCAKCVKTCPEISLQNQQFHNIKTAYAVWSLEKQIRDMSTSGGAAAEFYREALLQGYYICGVEYTDQFKVIHILSRSEKDICKFQQSKYVYSEVEDIYKNIKELLRKEEKILFISLPCKVSGLLSYLSKKYENLITVDIVCHGTPSFKQLHEHILNIDPEEKGKKLLFRNENEMCFNLLNSDGRRIYKRTGRRDTYLAAFLEGINYRKSCYQCKYAQEKRISDITICDFWGLGSKFPFNHPYTGAVSAVLINTEKGNNFFDMCKKRFFFEERPIEEAVLGNAQLRCPTKESFKVDNYRKLYLEKGFEGSVRKVLKTEMYEDTKKLIKIKLRMSLRKLAGIFIPRYRR